MIFSIKGIYIQDLHGKNIQAVKPKQEGHFLNWNMYLSDTSASNGEEIIIEQADYATSDKMSFIRKNHNTLFPRSFPPSNQN